MVFHLLRWMLDSQLTSNEYIYIAIADAIKKCWLIFTICFESKNVVARDSNKKEKSIAFVPSLNQSSDENKVAKIIKIHYHLGITND